MRIQRLFLVVSGVALTVCLTGHLSANSNPAPSGKAGLHKPAQDSDSAADPVLARVGRSAIRKSDLTNYLNSLPPEYRSQGDTLQGRQGMLRGLVDQKAVLMLARQAGIQDDPEYLKALKLYQDGQLSRLYMERLRARVSASDAEIRAYYDAHPQDFQTGTMEASVLVADSWANAQKLQKLLSQGQTFEAAGGVKMPPAHTGQADPAFERTFLALRKGQVSGIVKTAAGFELIRKDGELTGPPKPFEAVKEDIRAQLQNQNLYKLLGEEKAKLAITINDKNL